MDVSKYLGLPFVDGGRDPAVGLDCWGLVKHVLNQEFEIELPSLQYNSALNSAEVGVMARDESQDWRKQWRKVSDIKEADVILFRLHGHPSHVGIGIGGDADFLHTEPGKSCVIECAKSLFWINNIDSVWRHESR